MKKYIFLIAFLLLFPLFSACGSNDGETLPPASETDETETGIADIADFFTVYTVDAPVSESGFMPLSTLTRDAAGEVTVMVYGDEIHLYRDIGNPRLTLPDHDILIPFYHSALEFNKLYPYIVINALVVDFDYYGDSENGISLHESIENVKHAVGIMPDIWMVRDIKTEILNGNVSDLSRFNDEDSFLMFNDTLMDYMTFDHGFVCGIPGGLIPQDFFGDEMPDSITAFIEPLVIRTYAHEIDAYNKLAHTYAFAVFHAASDEAFPERGSLPLVKSPYFERQMEMWYENEGNEIYRERDLFPAFHNFLEIYLNGDFLAVTEGTTNTDVTQEEIRDALTAHYGYGFESP
jgi:hypothetical protein